MQNSHQLTSKPTPLLSSTQDRRRKLVVNGKNSKWRTTVNMGNKDEIDTGNADEVEQI